MESTRKDSRQGNARLVAGVDYLVAALGRDFERFFNDDVLARLGGGDAGSDAPLACRSLQLNVRSARNSLKSLCAYSRIH